MSARILDGRATAAAIKEDLRKRVADLAAVGRVPGLSHGDRPRNFPRWTQYGLSHCLRLAE